jgi:exopolysaccharide biosynthesis protein
MEFYALRIDLSHPDVRIVAAGGGGLAEGKFLSMTVSSFVRDNGLLAGINALPFDVASDREGEPRVNIGIVMSNGVMVSPPHARFDALVFYADGGVAIVSQSSIDSATHIVNAVGGFYRILEGGEIVPRALELKTRHPRSAAGISPDGKYLFLLAIDGRRPGSVGGTEAETASLLRSLGATEGINFDGGGSTALVLRYPDGTIRPVNTPIHGQIPGRERAVAGCLGILVVCNS